MRSVEYAYDIDLRVRDVRLSVELVPGVDTDLDAPGFDGFENPGNAVEVGVVLLLALETALQNDHCLVLCCPSDDVPRSRGRLRSHEDANLVELLPLAIERRRRPNIEVTGRYVKPLSNVAPLFKVQQTPLLTNDH